MHNALPAPESAALFFDFDGTLVDFATTPDGVIVPQSTRDLLLACSRLTGGATAIITGRSLTSLDSLLKLPQLPASGSHGAECRLKPNGKTAVDSSHLLPAEIASQCRQFAERHNLIFEDKTYSVAIHFRQAPEIGDELDQWLQDNIEPCDGIAVQYGKQVREIKRTLFDKGTAVAGFMDHTPFADRTPWYFGDDVTDEAAMKWVNSRGGVSVKIGDGNTAAQYQLDNYQTLLTYLEQISRKEFTE